VRIACRLRAIRKERGLAARLEDELGVSRREWYSSPGTAGVVIESDKRA
jgi:hypothetical protein